MEMITLPGTTLRVSRICLGTQQFSDNWEWPMDQATATATVHAALDAGINFFDTAEAYGTDGDRSSERMLGVALQGRRSEAVIASKFGFHAGEDTRVYDAELITAAIDESLAALGTDYIDLMQIHWPGNIGFDGADTSRWPDAAGAVAALEAAVSAGKIRHYGWCNFGLDDMAAFKAAGGRAVTNQLPYNLLWRAIEQGILPACLDGSIGVLCYSPLAQALLTGKYVNSADVPEGRRRSRLFAHDSTPTSRHGGSGVEDELFSPGAPAPENERFGASPVGLANEDEGRKGMYPGYGAINQLQAVADSTDGQFSMVDLAIGWLLAQPGVSCLLVGASTPEQARRNAKIPSVPAEVLEQCSAATERLRVVAGPEVDQHGFASRIHGNGGATMAAAL